MIGRSFNVFNFWISGAKSREECTNRCNVGEGEMALCDRNAHCMFLAETNGYKCRCKDGYSGDGSHGNCTDNCKDFCRNEGICLKVRQGYPRRSWIDLETPKSLTRSGSPGKIRISMAYLGIIVYWCKIYNLESNFMLCFRNK